MAKYNDFKSYIEHNYKDIIIESILNQEKKVVNKDCKLRCDEFEIIYLDSHDLKDNKIQMDAAVKTKISYSAYGSYFDITTKEYCMGFSDFLHETRWFNINMTSILKEGLHDLTVEKIEQYSKIEFMKENALSEFLIPYLNTDDLENIADDFFERYCLDALYEGYRLPYSHIMKQMNVNVVESTLPDTVFGRMYFKPTKITYWRNYYPFPKEEIEKLVPAGTMVINKNHHFMGSIGSSLNTIAHELVHWELHQKFFKILSLLDPKANELSCEVTPDFPSDTLNGIQKAMWWAEWQANNLAPRIVMPRQLFLKALAECYDPIFTPVFYKGEQLEEALEKVADLFGVSRYAAKVRAIQLGIMEAEGTFLYSSTHYVYPISFRRESLQKNQTFALDTKSYNKLLEHDLSFRELIESGKFVYADCFVVINDPLYVEYMSFPLLNNELTLTKYARENADECCLIFDREYETHGAFDVEYYGQCYLSKDISAYNRVEHKYNPHFEFNDDTNALAEEIRKYKEAFAEEDRILNELDSFNDDFPMILKYHMDRKNVTIEELSFRSGLSETTIKRYRNGKSKPDIDNIMAIFIGLNLPERYCDFILDALGLSLKERGTKQKVYRMLIREYSDGNIDQWNMCLKEFGLDTIPNLRNQIKN